MKKWNVLQKTDRKKQITKKDVIKILLENRGLKNEKDIKEFFNPSLKNISLAKIGIDKKEVKKAISKIIKAIKDKKSILVYSDYDVDGICAGAIVWETLYGAGAKVMPYIPHREKEGYGLSRVGIDYIRKKHKADLIIAVDQGVSNKKEVEYAKKCGMDTIIIDHHLLPRLLPKSVALVHTTKLSAGGIAWFFCNHFLDCLNSTTLSKKQLKKLKDKNLELAALSTIADLIPLLGVNRAIVKHGLEKISETKRIGLISLIKNARLKKSNLSAREVSFILAPRLNATGRLDHALLGLQLLCTKDKKRAEDLAKKICQINEKRRKLAQIATTDAIQKIESELNNKSKSKQQSKPLFVTSSKYHQGVISLVASRLVDKFSLPAFVFSVGEEFSKASARSVEGIDIVSVIKKAKEMLEDVGGHKMAAGFTIRNDSIELFQKKLSEILEKKMKNKRFESQLLVDTAISLSHINHQLHDLLATLNPFGAGNPEPIFATFKVDVLNAQKIGKEKNHLKIFVRDENTNGYLEAIGFGMGQLFDILSSNIPIDIAYSIDNNHWNNTSRLQLKLKDVNISC